MLNMQENRVFWSNDNIIVRCTVKQTMHGRETSTTVFGTVRSLLLMSSSLKRWIDWLYGRDGKSITVRPFLMEGFDRSDSHAALCQYWMFQISFASVRSRNNAPPLPHYHHFFLPFFLILISFFHSLSKCNDYDDDKEEM